MKKWRRDFGLQYVHGLVCLFRSFVAPYAKERVGFFLKDTYLENLITGVFLGNFRQLDQSIHRRIYRYPSPFFFKAEQMEIDQATYFVDSPFATDFVSLGGSTFHPSLLYKLKSPPVLLLAASLVGPDVISFATTQLQVPPFHHSSFVKKTGNPRKVSAGSLVLVQEVKDIIIEWGWLLAAKKSLSNGNAVGKCFQKSDKTSKEAPLMEWMNGYSTGDQKRFWILGNINQKPAAKA